MIEPGLKHSLSMDVTDERLANAVGSGTLPVFATPMMILLTEMTAMECVRPHLGEGQSTVGTLVNMAHSDSTPAGLTATCTVELIEVDRRRLVFKAEVRDDFGIIGSGTHERFIVDDEKFMAKASKKLKE